jgi:GDPmannose 4,6-dehydratase
MTLPKATSGTAIVMGAAGQDGFFLTERLLKDGWFVHATGRRHSIPDFDYLPDQIKARLQVHQVDLLRPQSVFDLIKTVQPDEFYNLAGQSSVSKSFSDPLDTWRTNAESVVHLLECIRKHSSETRFYQASSTDMFGMPATDASVFNEDSALNPQSPYASAKAAAHLLCHSFRQVYRLRIASGILSNHESHRRGRSFLSRKVVEHIRKLKELSTAGLKDCPPLAVGNLKVQRDWGFAPDYVDGMLKIIRQVQTRAAFTGDPVEEDEASNYRDYVLATGQTHAVWELIDCAFTIGGFDLDWDLEGNDPAAWRGCFRATKTTAVTVRPELLRTAEPMMIRLAPGRAEAELGWAPQQGLEVFLSDMFANPPPREVIEDAAKA